MELRHVLGNTWVAEANTALLGVYHVTEKDIVLIDTGYAKLDRAGLTAMIEDNGFRLLGVICSHAHFDHSGNVRYLQQRCGARAAAHIIEAGISVNPDAYRANYVALTYGKSREYLLEECFVADTIIGPEDEWLDFCGARFGILQLPGHSAGHIGVVTPDNVAYVGDCLLDQQQIDYTKLPTYMFTARDLQSKEFLRQSRYDAYIIAHKAVITDHTALDALVDSNSAFIYRKADELLEDLVDGMTLPSGSPLSASGRISAQRTSSSSPSSSGTLPTLWTGSPTRAASPSSGNTAPKCTTAPDGASHICS